MFQIFRKFDMKYFKHTNSNTCTSVERFSLISILFNRCVYLLLIYDVEAPVSLYSGVTKIYMELILNRNICNLNFESLDMLNIENISI